MSRRRLDLELVRRHLAPTRSAARAAITSGRVLVGGIPAPKPATLVAEDASVRLVRPPRAYVGRGGQKLEAALREFSIEVMDRSALDVGASTGGFTDCLLQHGASRVVALDVGYGQLAWSLRNDERVTVVERTNFRHTAPGDIEGPFDIVAADLSFISLRTVAGALRAAGTDDTDYVLLVKPQFEVGKDEVGAGGIVRDPGLHAAAIDGVAIGLDAAGIGLRRAVASPLRGAKGNREFLASGRRGPRRLTRAEIDEVVGA